MVCQNLNGLSLSWYPFYPSFLLFRFGSVRRGDGPGGLVGVAACVMPLFGGGWLCGLSLIHIDLCS